MQLVSFFFACSLIFPASSSRCPESKKPHLTSCTIFYSCVNLPNGGYVWIPSRCTEGLIFQPYLRMCVIPGDTWTCDSTEHTLVTNKYDTPAELVGYPMEYTSYSGYTQDPFSKTIDSSYAIDNFSDFTTVEAVTSYPLIEFEESDVTTRADKSVKNKSYHKEKNDLNEYYTNRQALLSLMEEYKNIIDSHYKCLNELINRLYNYKNLMSAISSLESIEESITTEKPTRTIAIFTSNTQRQNITLNYLVQSYETKGNTSLHNGKPIEMKKDDSASTRDSAVSTESTLQLLIDSLDSDNNVIGIGDNFGNKQYVTIDKYKTVASRLTSRFITIVACTRNVRMPNKTDCNRYYTCDPKTANVVEFSCPLHTAFNVYSRICDIESAKTCGNKFSVEEIFIDDRENATTRSNEKLSNEERLCQELGKIKDPASDSHYYICYSMPGSEDIKSIRMSCPNTLIFCQSKKVCTIRRLCEVSR